MNDEEIASIAKKLDEATQEMNCVVKIVRNGDDVSESCVIGSRGGYVKLAALCLRVLTSKGYETAEPIDEELKDLVHDDSDIWLLGLECDETLQSNASSPEMQVDTLKDKIALFGCALLLFVCVMVFIFGLIFIYQGLAG